MFTCTAAVAMSSFGCVAAAASVVSTFGVAAAPQNSADPCSSRAAAGLSECQVCPTMVGILAIAVIQA